MPHQVTNDFIAVTHPYLPLNPTTNLQCFEPRPSTASPPFLHPVPSQSSVPGGRPSLRSFVPFPSHSWAVASMSRRTTTYVVEPTTNGLGQTAKETYESRQINK